MGRVWLSAALLCASTAFAADPKPVEVKLADGGTVSWAPFDGGTFSAVLPGPVTSAERTDTAEIGPVKSLTYSATLDHEAFTVSIVEYPADAVKKSQPTQMLEGARDGAVANLAGVLEKDLAVLVDSGEPKKKYPGRDFTLHIDRRDGDGGVADPLARVWMDGHMFLVDNKLYVLLLTRDATVKDQVDFNRFVEGMKLRRPAKAPPSKAPKGK